MSLPVPFSKKRLAQNVPRFIDAQASVIPVVRMRAIWLIACPTFRIKGGLINTFITVQMSTAVILFFQLIKNIFYSYKQCNDYFMLTFYFKIYTKRKMLIASLRTLCSGLCKCNSKCMLVYKIQYIQNGCPDHMTDLVKAKTTILKDVHWWFSIVVLGIKLKVSM